jgi:hypothetical protein
MKPIFQWIMSNPSAFKSYLLALIAWIGAGYLAASGKVADLGPWSAFVDQGVDIVVGGLTIYGVGGGITHQLRGPALTSTEHIAAIVSLLQPATPAVAVEEVKSTVAAVASVESPAPQSGSHKF